MGEFPTEPIELFNAATAVDQYDEPPPGQEIPEYEPLQPAGNDKLTLTTPMERQILMGKCHSAEWFSNSTTNRSIQ